MEYNDENKLEIKVVILGCSSSGKTSIVNRYIGNTFDGNSPPTYGTTHFIKEIKIEDKSIIFNIWDTPGAERYLPSNKYFTQFADAIILIYSIDNKSNFEGLKDYWKTIIKKNSPRDASKKKLIYMCN